MKKICCTCGVEKDMEEYTLSTISKDGHIATCRVCINAKSQNP